jgi:hypothetical protein
MAYSFLSGLTGLRSLSGLVTNDDSLVHAFFLSSRGRSSVRSGRRGFFIWLFRVEPLPRLLVTEYDAFVHCPSPFFNSVFFKVGWLRFQSLFDFACISHRVRRLYSLSFSSL